MKERTNVLKRSDLIAEYIRLSAEEEATSPQARGQRFNGLIAETLQATGVSAKPNHRSRGEIDVVFECGGVRYILEAKWLRSPVDLGPIAMLQKRVRQRLAGTVGILVSISGFTQSALDEIKEGEQLSVLLLTREHFEFLLSGYLPTPVFFKRLLDVAHFDGSALVPLAKLLQEMTDATPQPEFSGIVEKWPQQLDEVMLNSNRRCRFKLIASFFGRQISINEICPLSQEHLALRCDEHVLRFSLRSRRLVPWRKLTCSSLARDSGQSLIAFENQGAVRISVNETIPVAGGLLADFMPCSTDLLGHAIGLSGNPGRPSLVVCTMKSSFTMSSYKAAEFSLVAKETLIVEQDRLVYRTQSSVLRQLVCRTLNGEELWTIEMERYVRGVARYSDGVFLIASSESVSKTQHCELALLETDTGRLTSFGECPLNLRQIVAGVGGGFYVLADYQDETGNGFDAILRLDLSDSFLG